MRYLTALVLLMAGIALLMAGIALLGRPQAGIAQPPPEDSSLRTKDTQPPPEDSSLRTKDTKTFITGPGERQTVFGRNLHYLDNGDWKDMDLAFRNGTSDRASRNSTSDRASRNSTSELPGTVLLTVLQ